MEKEADTGMCAVRKVRENPIDRGAWRAISYGVTKSDMTECACTHTHTHTHTHTLDTGGKEERRL